MIRDYQVVIHANTAKQSHELKIILDFLGEPCQIIDENFAKQATVDPNKVLALIVVIKSQACLAKVIMLSKHYPNAPIVLLSEKSIKLELPIELSQRTINALLSEFNYFSLLNILHQCQEFLENLEHVDNRGKNKPVTLFRSLVGTSAAINEVRNLIDKVAPTDASVLILGESGTGKEVVARNLHYYSTRKDQPFVAINCGAIPADLLESELFGHEKGAFTGAYTMRKGKFEAADGGTIFLDEIGDMPQAMQVKLLRILQEQTFTKVGGNKQVKIDVRVIAATHRDLLQAIKTEKFREDLYYRLNVFPIHMPPLRERQEDIPYLINELLARVSGQERAKVKLLDAAIQQLSLYAWPGNVRELANMIERLCILYPNMLVDVEHLPQKIKHPVSA